MNVIEALIVIGGIIGVAAVGLSLSGQMTKWWSSALYALITASLVVLMVAAFTALTSDNAIAVLWCARFGAASITVALACLYFLTQEMVDDTKRTTVDVWIQKAVVVFAALVFVLSFTPAVFPGAYILADGSTFVDAAWGASLFIVFISSALVLCGYYLISYVREGYHRRHGVIDLRFVAVRAVSYVFTLIIVALIFSLIATIFFRIFIEGGLVIAALIAALSLQPIRHFFNRHIDTVLYKENYSIPQFTMQLSQTLNSTNDLRLLLERTSKLIANTLKARQVFFFAHLPGGRYITAGTEHHSKVSPSEFDDIDALERKSGIPMRVLEFEVSHPLRRMMISHRIELVVPLYKGDDEIGFMCLGRSQKTGYTNRDLKALRSISDEVTIAIQNALSVDEVRKLNDTLEQRVSSATKELRTSNAQLQRLDEAKDEFISMASHQLRTPLTSIKGYISMMLEGDVGKITKEQKHMLNEAFVSSERMVRLIGDFLNVSRLQTGKFVIEKHPVDLALLVDREVDGLAQNAAARGIKFSYKKPKSIPTLELDENKIQQVVMNFADNAIYYSKDKSKIEVSLKMVGDFVEFRVIDTGIGVPKAEQEHLFNKFFRATNARRARPDGTGVGLFLAKKVIDDHKGSIIFESKEGKGSTFGFRLPLPKD